MNKRNGMEIWFAILCFFFPVCGFAQIGNPNGQNGIPESTSIKVAAAFPGADWCAKTAAALANLGSTPGEVWIDVSAGTTCATPPTILTGQVLRFLGGTFHLSTGWTITNQNSWSIAGLPGRFSTLQFDGNAGFTATGTGLTNKTFGVKITDVTFSGNVNIANVVTLIDITKSYFDFSARNCTGTAIVLQGSLLNTGKLVVSSNEGTFTIVPTTGILLDVSADAIQSNNNDFFLAVEGINGIGVDLQSTTGNIIRGTSEGNFGANGRGIRIGALGAFNTILNMDMEANNIEDILINGTATEIQNSKCSSAVRTHAGTTASGVWLLGLHNGTSNCIYSTVDAGAATLEEMDPRSLPTVQATFDAMAYGPGNVPDNFLSTSTVARTFTLPDASAFVQTNFGHYFSATPALSSGNLSGCGTSPTLVGTDSAGTITVGSAAGTGCILTFGTAWGTAPACVVSDDSAIVAIQPVSTTTTLTLTGSAALTGAKLTYVCIGTN